MKNSLKTNKQYFTLIELLVVMAILAILMSLLYPSLRKTIYTAKTVACASNLKQLGQGVLLYADDYYDHYPHTCKQTDIYGNRHMCRAYAQQVSSRHNTTVYYSHEELESYYGGEEGYKKVNTCPHTPGSALHNGFRNKMSTYNLYYAIGNGLPQGSPENQAWRINGSMMKLGDRWQGDRRHNPRYLWYNVMASDATHAGTIYGSTPGPTSNHPAYDENSGPWRKLQSANGYGTVRGQTNSNNLIDDGSVVPMEMMPYNTNRYEIGGFNLGWVPLKYGIEL